MRTPFRKATIAAVGAAVLLTIAPAAAAAAEPEDRNFYDGPSASKQYDGAFEDSHQLPDAALGDYIPQGVAAWPDWDGSGSTLLLVTAYREKTTGDPGTDAEKYHKAHIVGIDRATGEHVGTVKVAPSHVGGIAVVGDWVYVQGVSEDKPETIRRYETSELRDDLRKSGTPDLERKGEEKVPDGGGADFLSDFDGNLWAGRFNDKGLGEMHRYEIGGNGELSPAGDAWEVPRKTQGLLVTDENFIFSTSLGDDNRSNIYVVNKQSMGDSHSLDSAQATRFAAPSMSEGIAAAGGTAYLAFESAADKYAVEQNPLNKIPNLHKASISDLENLGGGSSEEATIDLKTLHCDNSGDNGDDEVSIEVGGKKIFEDDLSDGQSSDREVGKVRFTPGSTILELKDDDSGLEGGGEELLGREQLPPEQGNKGTLEFKQNGARYRLNYEITG